MEDWDQGGEQALVPVRNRQTLCSAVAAIESNAEEAGKASHGKAAMKLGCENGCHGITC